VPGPGPGPTGSISLLDYSYVNFGFVFLQDLVERAVIDVLTGKHISEPGLYINQFPYPCHFQDR